jgi:hypothetical protein
MSAICEHALVPYIYIYSTMPLSASLQYHRGAISTVVAASLWSVSRCTNCCEILHYYSTPSNAKVQYTVTNGLAVHTGMSFYTRCSANCSPAMRTAPRNNSVSAVYKGNCSLNRFAVCTKSCLQVVY